MSILKRRAFLKGAVVLPALDVAARLGAAEGTEAPDSSRENSARSTEKQAGRAYRIPNEYALFLPGEREALRNPPRVRRFEAGGVKAQRGSGTESIKVGGSTGGWKMLAILPWLNGIPTAVFEKHVTHQGAVSYVTVEGEIAHIPKRIGDLSQIKPRPVNAPPGVKFERPARYIPGPDKLGNYILNLDEDPCYENLAALGPEFTGWTLVANEEAGPEKSLWLEADGKSRQLGSNPQSLWAPDLTGRLFDPSRLLPGEYQYDYVPGYSKRTMLGGFLPAADIGVWNPTYRVGYEVMVLLPPGKDARPLGRVRAMRLPDENMPSSGDPQEPAFQDRYWNGSPEEFYSALAGLWNHWRDFFDQKMQVEIPDDWLLDAARAGIVMSRCSYRGLNPTYQIGEGAYTKIPERSHALFPVAHYEFIWAQQLWNLAEKAEPYFEHYLENYILPDGNFLYNTQDQVEAPLNAGVFLENSARAYDYTHDFAALKRRLPTLRSMADFVVRRYQYSKQTYSPDDPRHGLIWGSPEADNGDPNDDAPESHPYYYQNASWTWRGLREHARCLALAAKENQDGALLQESTKIASLVTEMRADIERSLAKTLAARNPEMKNAGITPFTPSDIHRQPSELTSYENHRYMMDWWTSDWGDPALDEGHFKHRLIAGEQILGLNTDGASPRTSNFMAHGTLAGEIRQDDYRQFLLTLYGLCCYTMDCGSRYSPEDALLPGGYPGEGSPYGWSAVVNSVLQPALGLRWLLCYEEHDRDVVRLQKAAPRHWFAPGQTIRVNHCPTRFGPVSWTTEALAGESGPEGSGAGRPRWRMEIQFSQPFAADLIAHIHPPDGRPLRSASMGQLQSDRVTLTAALLAGKTKVELEIS
ncbi:MAG: hypothetical protein ACRD2P_08650 [Terriglobia bacterium]